jgi:hypothetical protein
MAITTLEHNPQDPALATGFSMREVFAPPVGVPVDTRPPEQVVPESVEVFDELSQDEKCYMDIASDPFVAMLPEGERQEAIDKAFDLYKISKEHIAPVIASFAEYLLSESQGKQIIFAGRDGLGAFEAAKVLKDKFYGGDQQKLFACPAIRLVSIRQMMQ